jgi:DNA helicase II / ATP-dependent DNA helicase PcrA
MARVTLTEEQKHAAAFRGPRLYIEANPGSGKTVVASERFGFLRFQRAPGNSAIAGLSFTRSATRELRTRVENRWGTAALSWPHYVTTIDTLVCSALHGLLKIGLIRWPGGHVALDVLDNWQGHTGYRYLGPGHYKCEVVVQPNGEVDVQSRKIAAPSLGFSQQGAMRGLLANGLSTHEEVRAVLEQALRQSSVAKFVRDYLRASVSHLLVDEVFDANALDLELVQAACDADVGTTLIGDPWQALYGFRGAQPQLVPGLLQRNGCEQLPLSRSFRFKNAATVSLAAALRAGRPIAVSKGSNVDVVLASSWSKLWKAPDFVLPLSLGQISNRTDAAVNVLLDHLVRSRFGMRAVFLDEAVVLLGLDKDTVLTKGPEVLGGVAAALLSGSGAEALDALRDSMKVLGASQRPRELKKSAEKGQVARLDALRRRLQQGDGLVPGMTIHQAKGREWDKVGVALTPQEKSRLASGLSQADENDRKLYVALTRARLAVCSVA